jgi:hypothetical protein
MSSFVATAAGGNSISAADVCLTPAPPGPPVPVLYVSMADLVQTLPPSCSQKVKIENQGVLTVKSTIPVTSGDEAGANGGVMTGTIKGKAAFKKGCVKVMVEGANVVHQNCPTDHNNGNGQGVHAMPSQQKVLVNG